jgi:hypothetical protein
MMQGLLGQLQDYYKNCLTLKPGGKLGGVVHPVIPATQEAEARGLWIRGQTKQFSESLSQKPTNILSAGGSRLQS